MVPTTKRIKLISDMSEIEHYAVGKLLASKIGSVKEFLWTIIYIFSRQEKDRLISVNMEKVAAPDKRLTPLR